MDRLNGKVGLSGLSYQRRRVYLLGPFTAGDINNLNVAYGGHWMKAAVAVGY